MKCEYCDNEVPLGSTRCPSCGATVSMPISATLLHSAEKPEQGPNAASGPVCQSTQIKELSTGLVLKSKWVFIVLGIFLGEFGIHNFYLGYVGRGVVKLLITVLSFGLFFWVSWIWGVVEICTVRIDARGVPLGI